jgi:ferredoxin
MSRKITVYVDHNVCVANGMCRAIAPKAFQEDENGQSVSDDPNAEELEVVLEAAGSCPVGAIVVRDAETGEELDY